MIVLEQLYEDRAKDGQEPARRKRLIEAYEALFGGRGGKEDADLVLADLAFESGYFFVDDGSASDAQLRHDSGRRFLFGRIARFLSLSAGELAEIQRAISASLALREE